MSAEDRAALTQRRLRRDSLAAVIVCRLVLAALGAAIACLAAWQLAPRTLSISTTVVGTPTFIDFNYARYFDAFYLAAAVFPLLVIVLYAFLARYGPLRSAPASARLFPVAGDGAEPLTAEEEGWPLARLASSGARLAVPALVVALEVSAGSATTASRLNGVGLLAGLAYLLVLPAAALGLRHHLPRWHLAAWNALASLVVVPLAVLVSTTTSVTVAAPHRVVAFPWFPWWAAATITPALVAAVLYRLRRARSAGEQVRVESLVVAAIAGTTLVFLVVAHLPSALGSFGGFDDAQFLAGAQLTIEHGLLPWRDLYLLHGLLEDVGGGAVGFALFGHSRWGAVAGQSLVLYPIGYCLYYLFVLYFSRRSRLALAIVALAILGGETTAILRFVLLPLVFVVFDMALRTPRWRNCAALATVLVVEAILTPEIALLALGVLATLLVFELATKPRGERLVVALVRTRRVLVSGLVLGALFSAYLVQTGSLGGFVDYFRAFGSDHALWGAYALQWSLTGDLRVTTYFVLPVLLELATVARFASHLRRRAPLSTRDWSMLASASFVLLYFQKALDRPDSGHVIEVFTVSMPLVLLWGLEALDALEGGLRRALAWHAEHDARRATRSSRTRASVRRGGPIALLGVVVLLGALPAARQGVIDAPGNLHATAPTPAPSALLGYTDPGAINLQEIDVLGRIIDAYTPPGGAVFDFANEPGLLYFLLNRVPGSRYFHVEEAETPFAQQQVIAELEASRPHLVVFTDYDFGLPIVDGVVGEVRNYEVSQYLLDQYVPLADDDGQLVMIRRDLAAHAPSVSTLHLPGVVKGFRGSYFVSFACAWGDVPNFLSLAPLAGTSVAVPLSGGSPVNTEITGWAVDAREHQVAEQVLAVVRGRVVASTRPDTYRLDIRNYFESQPGWGPAAAARVVDAGFVLRFERPAGARVTVFARNADGTLSRLVAAPGHPIGTGELARARSGAVVSIAGADERVVRGSWLSGWLNTYSSAPERVYVLHIGRKLPLAAFQRLRVSAPGGIGDAEFVLSDGSEVSGRTITFSSLARAGAALTIPVGSCLQWHGYSGALTLVERGGGPRLSSVGLSS